MTDQSEPIDGWTWHDLANKIDWEGGLDEFFGGYFGVENLKDIDLRGLARVYVDARRSLSAYIDKRLSEEPTPIEPEDYEPEGGW